MQVLVDELPEAEFKQLLSACMVRVNRMRSHKRLVRPQSIASMAVGETRLYPTWKNANAVHGYRKERARIQLDNPNAQWSGRTTNQGVRVTRIK